MSKTKELFFGFESTAGELAMLVGPLDENLRQIETAFDVKIARRGSRFRLTGDEADRALGALEMCAARVHAGDEITVNDVQMIVIGAQSGACALDDTDGIVLKTRRSGLKPRTPHQKEYLDAIMRTDVTFGIGPAGTGKTYLAVAAAVDAYERDAVERIILTRPAIEAGERLGFLPGDLVQKVDPYLRPLYDALFDLFGFEKTQRLIEKQIIEIAPLAFMRGRTLNNAFVILDEAQNTTTEQMKMLLTRIGFGTRAVITGDITQIDLPKGVRSGLAQASEVLKDVKGISMVEFTAEDVVRHPLVGAIVKAYARAEEQEKREQEMRAQERRAERQERLERLARLAGNDKESQGERQ
jgi:phosphate starvation-inducible PhoH-like protein